MRGFSLVPTTLGTWRERHALHGDGLAALIDTLEAASCGTKPIETEIQKINLLEVLGRMLPAR
ncbi:MAG: hypothetical protein B7Y41_14890 [Hydrogenophilales bacterium 28-61-23]|nr:MAG: hypothetical protein B7Y41_14890 [Hydrogenophilales bacterium 28-61-23]